MGKFAVRNCRFGRGVFATQPIQEGEEILTFTGPRITLAEVQAKGEKEANPLQIGADLFIDLEEPGVLVNHSCLPNAGIKNDEMLVALRAIQPDEEIFYDYSPTVSGDPWTMPCDCREACCRKVVGDFKDLPLEVKQRYLDLGIVQQFIAQDKRRWGADG